MWSRLGAAIIVFNLGFYGLAEAATQKTVTANGIDFTYLETARSGAYLQTLIIAGDADGALDPEHFSRAEAAFTNGYRIEILENVGHFPQLEAPEQVADLILEFLGK